MQSNIVKLKMSTWQVNNSPALYQWDYGQKLVIEGIDLPETYEVHFSNTNLGESTTSIGDETGVDIPDIYLTSGQPIHVWVFLHQTESDGETICHGIIPITPRTKPTNREPTPIQQDVITQTIAALNAGVQEVGELAESIPTTIDTALQEAKDSGEFNGATFVPEVSDQGVISWTNNKGLENPNPVDLIETVGRNGYAKVSDIPTKVSELTNDSGYLLSETDPTVPLWAKQPVKPSYNAQEVGALPSDTFIPTKVSDLTNDSHYINQETDPTVPAWAKTQNKPTYTAQEVGALPSDTFIPEKVSDLIDDSGHYTKPESGIPASDLASGVIPNITPKADKVSNAINGNFAALDSSGNLIDSGHKHSDYLTEHQDISGKLDVSLKGSANGLAELDANGKVPVSQIPGSVDEIIEGYLYESKFYKESTHVTEIQGESGKIYVDLSTEKTYRWSGSMFVEISASLALGETSSTAYRGDYGKIAYDHASAKGSAYASGLYKITTNSEGHITNATAVQKSDITDLGIPGSQPDVSGFYTKPANGIPASDLEAGVIPLVPVTDVQINGTSILNNGVANVPAAGPATLGVCKINAGGLYVDSSGQIKISKASSAQLKAGTSEYAPIVPSMQHESVFYGLTKAAGVNMSGSSNAVGVYTDSAKQAIQKMFGFDGIFGSYESDSIADKAYVIGETFIMNGKRYKTTAAIAINDVIVPDTNCELCPLALSDVQVGNTSIIRNGIAVIPVRSNVTSGNNDLVTSSGIYNALSGMTNATSAQIKAGTSSTKSVVLSKQHESIFYGLSKLAGVDLASASGETVGVYPDDSKQAIQKMLGMADIFGPYEDDITADQAYAVGKTFIMGGKRYKVTADIAQGDIITVGANCELCPINLSDVQINGTSILSNGVANIPKAGNDSSHMGVIYASGDYGVGVLGAGGLYITRASSDQIKAGNNSSAAALYKPITPQTQHESVYYALAKLAGADMASASGETVGVYPEAQKAAIQSMLGVSTGAILIESVSGSTPSITALPNVRYNCGEVSTLSITPSASGSCEVIFTSGSTATLLTVPNTVKFPAWFDATSLEANTIYDIVITDGVYGAVMSWAS